MRLAKSTKIILISIFFLVLIQLVVSSRLSAIGRNVSFLEKRYKSLSQENEIIRQKVASSSSLLTIRSEARKLDLRKPAEVLFVDEALYVVQR